MKIYELLEDVKDIAPHKYDSAVDQHLDSVSNQSDVMKDNIYQSKQMLRQMFPNGNMKTMSSGSGKFKTQWYETDDTIFLLGIISDNFRIAKEDIKDVLIFIDMLLDKLEKGYNMITSANYKSMRIINNMKKRAIKKGISLDVTNMGNQSFGPSKEENFSQVMVSIL